MNWNYKTGDEPTIYKLHLPMGYFFAPGSIEHCKPTGTLPFVGCYYSVLSLLICQNLLDFGLMMV